MVSFVIFYLFLSFLFAGVLVFTILQVVFNFNRYFTYLAGIQVLCYCVHDSPFYAGVSMGGLNLSLLKKRGPGMDSHLSLKESSCEKTCLRGF